MKYLNLLLIGVCALVIFLLLGATTYAGVEYRDKLRKLEVEPGIIQSAIRPDTELLAAAVAETDEGHAQKHERGFAWKSIVEPLGITTLLLLIATLCLGFLTRKNFQLLFKWHRLLAILTLISALCHATLVFIAH